MSAFFTSLSNNPLFSGIILPLATAFICYDRMTDAGVTPDFPRPAPPSRWLALIGGLLTAAAFFTLWRWLGV